MRGLSCRCVDDTYNEVVYRRRALIFVVLGFLSFIVPFGHISTPFLKQSNAQNLQIHLRALASFTGRPLFSLSSSSFQYSSSPRESSSPGCCPEYSDGSRARPSTRERAAVLRSCTAPYAPSVWLSPYISWVTWAGTREILKRHFTERRPVSPRRCWGLKAPYSTSGFSLRTSLSHARVAGRLPTSTPRTWMEAP